MSDKSLAGLRIVIVEGEVLIADDTAEELAQLGARIMGPARTLSQAEAPSSAASGSTSPSSTSTCVGGWSTASPIG